MYKRQYLLLHNISKRIYANLSLNIDIVYICVLYDRLNDMAKNTMGTKLPRKLEQKMQIVGEQIKLARLRRNLTIAQVAERATCSPLTVSRIEKGTPTVAIGIYLRVPVSYTHLPPRRPSASSNRKSPNTRKPSNAKPSFSTSNSNSLLSKNASPTN